MNSEEAARSTFPSHEGDCIAVKLVVDEGLDLDSDTEQKARYAKRVMKEGERRARLLTGGSDRHDRAWVQIYAPDMPLDGPAICVSYAEPGLRPRTEFTPMGVHQMWAMGQNEVDAEKTARVLHERGEAPGRIRTVLESITTEDEAERILRDLGAGG